VLLSALQALRPKLCVSYVGAGSLLALRLGRSAARTTRILAAVVLHEYGLDTANGDTSVGKAAFIEYAPNLAVNGDTG
jgi:hypothetical protein